MVKKAKRRTQTPAASNSSQSLRTASPPKPTGNPNVALKQVREATGMTQADFGDFLGVSAPYIQAVELGQRQANSDLARRVEYTTGVWYTCILEGWQQAVDSSGEPYTIESYKKFRSSDEEHATDEQIRKFVEPLAALTHAAGKKGKISLLGTIIRRKLVDILRQLDLQAPLNEVLKKQRAPVAKKITVGELRTNPSTAALLGYRDDHTREDDDVITIEGVYEARADLSLTWFPSIDWYPRPEEIRQKYLQRCAAIHEPARHVAVKIGTPTKQK